MFSPLPLKYRPLFAAALAALAATSSGASNSAPPTSAWNVVDHIPCDRIIVQSHRGAGNLAPENTLAAFELGWKLGTYPECDVRTTADKVIVTFHDENFRRVVKGADAKLAAEGVKDLTYAELQRLDVGTGKEDALAGRRICKLTDVFVEMRGRPERHFYVEPKKTDFLPQLAQEVHAYGVERQIVFVSHSPETIIAWKKLMPQSETLLWNRGGDEVLRRRIAALRQTNFAGITQFQIHVFPNKTIEEAMAIAGTTAVKLGVSLEQAKASADPFTPSSAFIRELGQELRAHHILFQALPYTDDPGVYAQLLDLGLMSFATDHPDVTTREIQAYYARHSAAVKP